MHSHAKTYQYFKNGSEQAVNEEFSKNGHQHEVSVYVIELCQINMKMCEYLLCNISILETLTDKMQ